MVRVLTEPRNAIIRQYQKLFELENAQLQFTDAALRTVAERAMEKDTGARGLRAVVEEVMLDLMFELPETGAGKRYLITPEIVLGRERVIPMPIAEPKHKSA